MKDVLDQLAQIAGQPEDAWPRLAAERFAGDRALAAQALVWLRANQERVGDDESAPVLASDRYELGVLLDVGATASVWQAHDAKLGRNVAIKVFRGERSPVVDEILAEARAAAEVTSDHVVRVLDVHGDPPYIVMELVGEYEPKRGVLTPGGSAATVRPRSLAEAVRWVRDVARGVHDAHLRNVFHRDLKPHNVLVTPLSRRARDADFGLAVSEAHAPANSALQIAGTPGYIAPEQAGGLSPRLDPHDLDDRAVLVALDVWGLGAIAYDLMTDRAPWTATDEHGEPWELAASATQSPQLPRAVPRRLRRIVNKALALSPKARYATAAELADDLDAYLRRDPTSHDRSRVARFALWCRRNPQLTLTALLATGLAAVAGVAYNTVVEVRAQRNALALEDQQLEQRAKVTKQDLAETEAELGAKGKELESLRHTLVDADREYKSIVAAKDQALHTADTETRQLAEELANMRSERDAARLGGEMYEGFWTRARTEADDLIHARDQLQHDLDEMRVERDAAQKASDDAVAARTRVEQERDRAIADRDRAEATRRRVEADLARLAADLSALRPHGLGSGAGSGSGSGSAGSPP